MRNLQILMSIARDSDSEVIKRARGSHALTGSFRKDLTKVLKNKLNDK